MLDDVGTYPLSYRRQSHIVPATGKAIAPTVRTSRHRTDGQVTLAVSAAEDVKAGQG